MSSSTVSKDCFRCPGSACPIREECYRYRMASLAPPVKDVSATVAIQSVGGKQSAECVHFRNCDSTHYLRDRGEPFFYVPEEPEEHRRQA